MKDESAGEPARYAEVGPLRTAYCPLPTPFMPKKTQDTGRPSRSSVAPHVADTLSKWGDYGKFGGSLGGSCGTHLRRHFGSFGLAHVARPRRFARVVRRNHAPGCLERSARFCGTGSNDRLGRRADPRRGGTGPDGPGSKRDGVRHGGTEDFLSMRKETVAGSMLPHESDRVAPATEQIHREGSHPERRF